MKPVEVVLNNEREVLEHLKEQFPVFHLSNIFFRDIQYGIQSYLKGRNLKVDGRLAEAIAHQFIAQLERETILRKIDEQTWMVHLEAFKTPTVKK